MIGNIYGRGDEGCGQLGNKGQAIYCEVDDLHNPQANRGPT